MIKCLFSESKKFLSFKKLLYVVLITIVPFMFRFLTIREGYIFYSIREVFEESIQSFIPMLFPILIMGVYANGYIIEYKNEYIRYNQPRIDIWKYIKGKLLINSILTFIVGALIILIPYSFCQIMVARYGLVELTPIAETMSSRNNSLTFLFEYSSGIYILVYTLWVSINAVLYSSLGMLISLHKKNTFIALSIPIIFYHMGNFFFALIGFARFSPLVSIFPFNVTKMGVFNFFVPFIIILTINIVLLIYSYNKYKQSGDYYV